MWNFFSANCKLLIEPFLVIIWVIKYFTFYMMYIPYGCNISFFFYYFKIPRLRENFLKYCKNDFVKSRFWNRSYILLHKLNFSIENTGGAGKSHSMAESDILVPHVMSDIFRFFRKKSPIGEFRKNVRFLFHKNVRFTSTPCTSECGNLQTFVK